ncbi:MAG: MBL fold metallo-hydrolase [Bacteriovoracaceae bacterium]
MVIQHFFDKDTSTLTYVVYDDKTRDAIIIDPVLDFDPASGRVSNESYSLVLNYLKDHQLNPHYVIETHAHADHLSSSQVFKKDFPNIKIAISERIKTVQEVFGPVFNMKDLKADGSDFDFLISDEKEFFAGSLKIFPIPTPGHTPACTSFLIEDHLFTGDSLFMPDYGTGRCDFPKGSAKTLFDSIQKIFSLPDSTKIYVGHDYQPNNRELKFLTTVGESKKSNIHITANTSIEDFVNFREGRDKTLKAPRLLFPSLQVNIVAGKLPRAEDNGIQYIKLPLKIKI